jgi:hypothetical protein
LHQLGYKKYTDHMELMTQPEAGPLAQEMYHNIGFYPAAAAQWLDQ